MNECKWIGCESEARAKSDFCSDKCSKRFRRRWSNPDRTPQPTRTNPDKVSDLVNPDSEPGQVTTTGWIEDVLPPDDYTVKFGTAAVLLDSWADGMGNSFQWQLGRLAQQYSVINGHRPQSVLKVLETTQEMHSQAVAALN